MDQVDTIASTQSSEEITPRTNVVEDSTKKNSSRGLVIFLLVLVITLLGAVTFLFLTDRLDIGIENPLSKDVEEAVEKDTENMNPEIEDTEYVFKNNGWGLFSLPEYQFSVEMPSYTLTIEHDSPYADTISSWSVSHEIESISPEYLDNYVHSVNIDFFPDSLDSFGCGGGCAKEHFFRIKIFEKDGDMSLSEITEVVSGAMQDKLDAEGCGSITSEKIITKWDLDVAVFEEDVCGDYGSFDHFITVNDEYVFVTKVFMNTSPADSVEIAQRVLESFVFSE